MKKRQTSESFLLSAIISLSGGFQDAYTYNIRGNVFANAQTGNIVLMSQHFMMGDWLKALHYLMPIVAFAIGVIISEQFGYFCKSSEKLHWRQMILLIEIIVLAAVAFIPDNLNMLANALVSMSCAMQVQTFRKVNGYPYASTMCIGNLRSGTDNLSNFIRNRKAEALDKALHYYGIILIFAIGAGIGGVVSNILGIRSILGSSAILLVAFVMMFKRHI
ncbi:YoaK family protein [Pseudobutyrivibrio sp. MD2005]|uniref:YoaK family protein n=1 Tax=Pseudobutyrivibrio sp. MD2005 TaxID=1410616 RepID=UPI0004837829|nr:YoaK family protein [Pseudobutyrivibrio sp. MD2005]